MVRADIFKSIPLQEKGFAFCPELNTKLSNIGIKINEIPINYNGRTYDEGKKISAVDGLIAIKLYLSISIFPNYMFNKIKYQLIKIIENIPQLQILIYNHLNKFKFLFPHDKDYLALKLLFNKNEKEIL